MDDWKEEHPGEWPIYPEGQCVYEYTVLTPEPRQVTSQCEDPKSYKELKDEIEGETKEKIRDLFLVKENSMVVPLTPDEFTSIPKGKYYVHFQYESLDFSLLKLWPPSDNDSAMTEAQEDANDWQEEQRADNN